MGVLVNFPDARLLKQALGNTDLAGDLNQELP
jgi:hypothetical protein